MSGAIASNAIFTFAGFSGSVTSISVETPSAEIVNMSSVSNGAGAQVLVPTKDRVGGSITVGFMSPESDPQGLVGTRSTLRFTSSGYSVSRNVILESASVEVRTGEVIRGSLKFQMTDYYGN
jgi:hypothetical protein